MRAGDWPCSHCNAIVFASKNVCFQCQTPRGQGSSSSISGHQRKQQRREKLYKPTEAAKNLKDKTLTCKACAAEFVFTAKEQHFFQTKWSTSFNADRARCNTCSKKKKRPMTAGATHHRPTIDGRLACFAFLKGTCTYGDDCKFAHGKLDDTTGNRGKGGNGGDRAEAEEGGGASDGEASTPPAAPGNLHKEEKKARKAKKRAKLDLGEAGAGQLQRAGAKADEAARRAMGADLSDSEE